MNKQRAYGYVFSLAIGLLAWKLAAVSLSSPILPGPEETIKALVSTVQTDYFWSNFIASAYRVGVSIALAWVFAFPLGLMIGYYQKMDRLLSPLIFITYPIPKMVFLPVVILLFGVDDLSKIALITVIIFFQILVATKEGVSGVDRKYIDSMRSMNASESDILREAVIPAALPSSFTALRIVTGTAISVLFFVESFAGSSGLGYMIVSAWNKFQYVQIYVGIIAMSIMGIVLYELFTYCERRLCRWKVVPEDLEEASPSLPLFKKITSYAQMIKLSHSIFALPFGLAALVLLSINYNISFDTVFWAIMAIVGARSAAMGFNRVADASIDARNPRTSERHIPAGALTVKEALAFVILASALFIFSAAMLSTTCLILSFPVLAFLFAYSYTKRLTWGSHIVLGISIGMMPLGACVAVTGWVTVPMVVLSLALTAYIAGFDILYACQDLDFDRKEGLFSIPARFGVGKALAISSSLHVISVVSLFALYWLYPLGAVYLAIVAAMIFLFIFEHRLVNPNDLSKVNVAFFNTNCVISVLVFLSIVLGVMLR